MNPTILLYQDDDGYKRAVYSKIDDWHIGHTIVPSMAHPDIDDAYINGIAAMNGAWKARLEVKAGVPDDADQKTHPVPLDQRDLEKVMEELKK